MRCSPFTSLLMLGSVGLSAAPALYQNPVLDGDFPDPFVLKTEKGYRMWATNGRLGNVPSAVSPDLVRWEAAADAMPVLAPWVAGGFTWAPEVIAVGGRYLMYYTARDRESGRQAVGVAEAQTAEGPFVDSGTAPLVCQSESGGSIDASPFLDRDGTLYLLWKNDGNAVGMLCTLYLAPLSQDGRTFLDAPLELISNDALWEGNLVEAPTLFAKNGWYYLLYSASDFGSDLYGVGVAVSRSPRGPFTKAEENPIVSTKGAVSGPGHQCLVLDDAGQEWLVYHAWTTGQVGYQNGGVRSVRIDPIRFQDGKVLFEGPSSEPREAPVQQNTKHIEAQL